MLLIEFSIRRLLFIALVLFSCGTLMAATITSAGTGNWNATGTWVGGVVPVATDHVIIATTHDVNVNFDYTCANLTINTGGILTNKNARSITVNGNYTNNGTHVGGNGGSYLILAGSNTSMDGQGSVSVTGGTNITSANKDVLVDANLTFTTPVTITGAITVVNYGTVTMSAALAGTVTASTWENANGGYLKCGAALLATGTLTASATNNTVEYYQAGAQNIKTPGASTYYHLVVAGSGTKSLSGQVIVAGNLSISSELDASITNYGVNLKGNWTNTGSFTERSGTVTFSGTGAQSVTNSLGETFYGLTINKVTGTLTLNHAVTVSNTLTLTAGPVDASSATLTLGTGLANIGSLSYTSGAIKGNFQRWVNTAAVNYLFPVGLAAYYRPAIVNFDACCFTGGSLVAAFIESDPGISGLPLKDGADSIRNTFSEGYWTLTPANGLASTNYDLKLLGNGFASFARNAATRLLTGSSGGAPWTASGNHWAAVADTAKRDAISVLSSQHCFGDTTQCTGPSTSAISGTDSVCKNATGVAYSVTNTPGSTYAWTITGGTVASGQGLNSITVNWGSAGGSGNVRVTETNSCKAGAAVNLPVDIHVLSTSAIEGDNTVAANASGIPYAVTARPGYSYSWMITGGSVASGQGTASITVNWGAQGGGNVSVTASTGCGSATAVELSITKYGTIKSIASGSWSSAGTWDCSCVPNTAENIVIDSGHTVTLGNNTIINTLIIYATGTLADNNRTMEVTGDFTCHGTYSGGTKDLTLSGSGSTIDGRGTISTTGNLVISTGNKTIASTATLTRSGGTTIINADIQVTNNGTVTFTTAVTGGSVASTWFNSSDATVNIGGAFLATGAMVATASGNTVKYNGTAAQNVKQTSGASFYNLTIAGSNTVSLQQNITVTNNLSVTSTLDVTATNYTIAVGGGWTNTGAFTERSGTVTFNGSTAQSVTNAAGETFYNMTVNKASGTLTLNNNVVVSNTLVMTKGNIAVGVNTLTLGTGLGVEGSLSYTAGYIVGSFRRWMNTTSTPYVFPIGSATNSRNVKVTCTSMTGGTLVAKFVTSAPGTSGCPLDDGAASVYNAFTEGYWDLEAQNGLVSTNYNLELTGGGFFSYTIVAGTRVVKRADAGSPWSLSGTHTAASGSTAKRSGMSGFSHFALGDVTPCAVPVTSDMTGSDSVCGGTSGSAYSVTNTSGNTYTWIISGGSQASGGTTNSITVDWGTTGMTGSVKCVESSNCGNGDTVTLSVDVHTLPTSVISGNTSVAESTTEAYSVENRTGYTYNWFISGGTQAGGGTSNSIAVDWGGAGTGKVKCLASTGCGAAADTIFLNVTKNGTISSNASGDWNNSGTWSCACIPTTSDNIVILNGHAVTLDASDTVALLNINTGGTLNSGTYSLLVNGNYTVNGTHSGSGTIILNGNGSTIDGTGTMTNSGEMIIATGNKTIQSSATLTKASGQFTIGNDLTVTNNGTITLGGNIVGGNAGSTWAQGSNGTLNVGGALLATGVLNASAAGNTVNYNGASAQNVKPPASSYTNLTIAGSNTKTLTAATTVAGNLTVSSTLDVSGSDYGLNIGGNWNNSGSFVEQNGTVTLNGTGAQSVTNTSGEVFHNLTINKSSGTLTLNDHVMVANTLTMNNGNINTGSDTLVLGADAINVGTLSRTSGTVIGLMKRWIKDTGTGITFPIGTATSYRPALVNFTQLNSGSLTASFIASSPGTTGLPVTDGAYTVDATFTEGYWRMAAGNNLASTSYALNLTGTGFTSATVTSVTRLLKRSSAGNPWTTDGTHVAASGSTVKRSAMSGFSEFAFGDTAACAGPATSAITGSDSLCTGSSGAAYSVTSHAGNTYIWTVIGGTLASGQGTNAITANWGSTGRDDAIVRVVESDVCTSADPVDKTVALHVTPISAISGNNTVAEYSSGVAYSVTAQPGYTFTWTVVGDSGTVVSGQGTNSIVVDWKGQNSDSLRVVSSCGCSSTDTAYLPVNIYTAIVSTGTGNWNNTAIWSCACLPGATDNITIKNGHTITMIANRQVGNINVESGGTLNNSTYTLTVNGDYIVDGVHSGTGDITLNGSGTSIGGSGSITNSGTVLIQNGNKSVLSSASLTKSGTGNFSILSGNTVENYGILDFDGAITGAAGSSVFSNKANATLKISGALLATGTLNTHESGNTVEYDGSGAQNVKQPAGSYHHLKLSTGGTKTLTSNVDVNGNLTIGAATFDVSTSSFSIAAAGNFVNNGLFTQRSGTVTFDGTSTLSGTTTTTFHHLTVTGTLTGVSGGNFNVAGNWINNGNFNKNNGTVTFTGSGGISGSTVTEFYNIVISGTLTGNANFKVSNGWTNNGTFTPVTGAVTFDGSTTIAGSSATTLKDVTITGTFAGSTTNMNVTGNWVNNGAFNHNNGSVTFTGTTAISGSAATTFNNVTVSGTLTAPASANMNIAGDWTNNGSFSHNGGTVTFTDSSIVTGSSVTTFNHVVVNANSKVTVPTGKTLTTAGNLTIKSDASGTASYVEQGTGANAITGTVTVQRYLDGSNWHYVSVPVTGSNVNLFHGYYMYQYSEPLAAWQNLHKDSAMETMRGYTVKRATGSTTVAYTGPLHSGNHSISVTHTPASAPDDGFNLVGNPYPCAIDWDAGGWTKTNVDNAVYFYDESSTTYSSYVGGVGNPGGTTGIIPAMQGFYIHASANGTLGVSNAVRLHHNLALYKKKGGDAGTGHLFRLRTSGGGYADEAVIRFDASASDGFDSDYDAYKLSSYQDQIPEISSLTGDLATDLSINALPDLLGELVIPLHFKAGLAGEYTIAAFDIRDVDGYASVYLVDQERGHMTDILKESYRFSTDPVDTKTRFVIQMASTVGLPEWGSSQQGDPVLIYEQHGVVYIHMGDHAGAKGFIQICDLPGRVIYQTGLTGERVYPVSMRAPGYYLVRVAFGSHSVTKKVMIPLL